MTGPAGIANTYTWDAASHLSGLAEQSSAGNLAFSYTYDPVGNVLSRIDPAGNNGYTFDSLNRLTGATHPAAQPGESYTYDAVGNRKSSNLSTSYSYDAANRLLSDSTYDYTVNAKGDLTKKTERATGKSASYNYDLDSRMKTFSSPTFDYSYYSYDGLGRRIAKTVANTTTQYVYDGPNIIAEYDNNGSLVARYTHGPGIDEVLSVKRGGTTSYFQRDGLGSVVQTVSASGNTSSYKYDSYGRIISQAGSAQSLYAFTGREYDSESGLYYYRARYYNPDAGRFMSEDPIGLLGGLNQYAYVRNNPITLTDPMGLSGGVTQFAYGVLNLIGGLTALGIGGELAQTGLGFLPGLATASYGLATASLGVAQISGQPLPQGINGIPDLVAEVNRWYYQSPTFGSDLSLFVDVLSRPDALKAPALLLYFGQLGIDVLGHLNSAPFSGTTSSCSISVGAWGGYTP